MNNKKLGFIEIIFKGISGTAFIIGLNPLLAGRWDYWPGWVFSAVMAVMVAVIFVIFRDKLDLIQERMHPGPGVKWWDLVILAGLCVLIFSAWIIGVLATGRFHWSAGFPVWGYVLSYLIFIFSVFLFTWPMAVNQWFSSLVRIQDDRGQQVCQEGPYKYVRHPGYAGGILMAFSLGLLFGSLWTLIPGGLAAGLLILRTYLEDQTLQKELPGYSAYAKKVRYRLVPGIW